jgi:hypothetical protein
MNGLSVRVTENEKKSVPIIVLVSFYVNFFFSAAPKDLVVLTGDEMAIIDSKQ